MGVNFILNFMMNPNMNFILLSEVIRIKPMLKLNEILNRALLKYKIEEIGIHTRARPTILLHLSFILPDQDLDSVHVHFFLDYF